MCGNKHLRNQGGDLGQHIELREASYALAERVGVVQHALRDHEVDQRIGNCQQHDESANAQEVGRRRHRRRPVPEVAADSLAGLRRRDYTASCESRMLRADRELVERQHQDDRQSEERRADQH